MHRFKFLLAAWLSLSLAQTATAQDLQLWSAGGLAAGDNAFSFGETFVDYYVQGNSLLTEGFHQPTLGPGTHAEPAWASEAFGLSPNPAADFAYLRPLIPITTPCHVILYDLHGHLLWESVLQPGQDRLPIPLHALSQSMYFLRVDADHTYTFKVEKIGI